MIKFGPAPGEMRKMSADDIFSSRLKLLIIMAKAYLIGCPLGKYRKQTIIENAHHVFYHSMHLVAKSLQNENHSFDSQTNVICKGKTSAWHFFHKRVQLLAVMAKALAEDRSIGNFRIRALNENLDEICETLIFDFQMKDANFLKAA